MDVDMANDGDSGMQSEDVLTITVNGQVRETPPGATVADLLQQLSIEGRYVVVQLNGQIVPRAEFAQQVITGGSTLEIITLVGGG